MSNGSRSVFNRRAGTVLQRESIFSLDVEDWFHILQIQNAPPLSSWDALPSRVEANFLKLLDLFDEHRKPVTCFFLGWVGERFPHLVREAHRRGHEIASHGYGHRLVFEMTRQEFHGDALRSRVLLEDTAGTRVRGYRSAGFSVTPATAWFFDELIAAGYEYDSSVFPAVRQHGGMRGAHLGPYRLQCDAGTLTEFPISVTELCGVNVCMFGGGYLRLFPYWLIACKARHVLGDGRPLIFYVHPREIDPDHPRLRMPALRRFKSYVNLHTTERKVERIAELFPLITFSKFLERYGDSLPVCRTVGPELLTAAPAAAGRLTATGTQQ